MKRKFYNVGRHILIVARQKTLGEWRYGVSVSYRNNKGALPNEVWFVVNIGLYRYSTALLIRKA